MGNTFSYELLYSRVVNVTSLAVSVIDQCSNTLAEQNFKCQNCPNLIFNGISFEETQVVTNVCVSSQTIVTQIRAVVTDYLLTTAKSDQELGFPDSSFDEYLTGMRELSLLVFNLIIENVRESISGSQLFCTPCESFEKCTNQQELFVQEFMLNFNLTSKIPKQIATERIFNDLVVLLSATDTARNKSKGVIIFGFIFMFVFILSLILMYMHINCGYIALMIAIVILIASFLR